MNYRSTRSTDGVSVSAAQAIKTGLAPDGGLFMPEQIPSLSEKEVLSLCKMSYPERAATVLSKYLTDYTYDELYEDASAAYSADRFLGGAAPIRPVDENVTALELWHGPTAAFKDMALQIMPRLLSRALVKTGEKRTAYILVATSGDTGKAALEGYKDIPQIKIKVFYPVDGVSKVQKLQMVSQTGNNVDVCAIRGNFDDAQTGVKNIFADRTMAERLAERNTFLSSANSINWGRLAPQIVYYVSAYCDMINAGRISYGDKLDICVPTGNFGNIFAALLAKRMGLPLGKLICASNKNNVLTDFLRTGVYNRNRAFYTTISPSMDILISSNLERLLYVTLGAEKTAAYMRSLNTDGKYALSNDELALIQKDFVGYCADEEKTAQAIRLAYEKHGYLCDSHTAVGYSCAQQYLADQKGEITPIILASTASPYKFAADVYLALTGKHSSDGLTALEDLTALTKVEIPMPLADMKNRTVRFNAVVDPDEMPDTVLAFAAD
ncbi:MAG: threonine synthase [Clostridia bacterium]|nr:threonine synthase [Clostridia bacterium]